MRDLPPGAVGAVENVSGTDPVSGDFSDDADDTVDSSSTHDSNTPDTAPRGAPATDIDLSPPPQSSGSISWTGLSAPEPAPSEPALVEPSPSEAARSEDAPPVAAAEASEPPSGAEAPAEKKVVWSSSPPDRFTTFGGNTRRDDY